MSENHITRVQWQDKEIILIATAHVSKESAELVRKVVEEERPDSVCIELDDQRYQNIKNPKAWESTDIVKVIKSRRVGFLIVNLFLSAYQKKMAKKLNTTVGGEMLQGMASAEACSAQLVLADRNIQTTFMRLWRKMSFWEKMKLLFGLLMSFDEGPEITDADLQELLKKDMLESVLAGFKKQVPQVGEILIHERDQYLANKIKHAPGKKVVAVLGGAHVPGVTNEIPKEQDLEALSIVPPQSKLSRAAGWLIPVLITGMIAYGFVLNLQTGVQLLTTWALWTGSLAALFTALSLGHPLSILTAFVAAPVTTLHPLLASGWFAGLVEAFIKKPTVSDIQNVHTDIFSLRGFFKNRFLKIILVVCMANIGTTIGTLIAGTNLVKNLF